MRVLFMGTGEIALPSFRMVAREDGLVGLVTQPDRPVGRHAKLQPPLIKEVALEAGVPVLQPERVRHPRALAEIAKLVPELIVVMAYGQILPRELLEMPAAGCINVHASLLPRHRGASCLQAAIDAGDRESGITVMHMAEGLDEGDLILKRSIELSAGETGRSLHDRLAALAPGALKEAIERVERGSAARLPQEESLATYAPKLERADGEIDWRRSAAQLERRVRAYHPWPGTFTAFRDGQGRLKRLKVFPPVGVEPAAGPPGEVLGAHSDGILVSCGEGAVQLAAVQPDGGRRMTAGEFLAGHRLTAGDRFFSLAKGHD